MTVVNQVLVYAIPGSYMDITVRHLGIQDMRQDTPGYTDTFSAEIWGNLLNNMLYQDEK
jgi:hypothetical protein